MKIKGISKLFIVLGLISSFASGLYSNGIFVNSIGAKAISMGGAFIGMADDYSAVFWNLAPGPETRLNILLPSPDGSWLTLGCGFKTDKF